MAVDLTLLYVAMVVVLFFFWAYGIVSFVLDLKNKIIPGVRQLVQNRRERKQAEEREQEREEREQQLY